MNEGSKQYLINKVHQQELQRQAEQDRLAAIASRSTKQTSTIWRVAFRFIKTITHKVWSIAPESQPKTSIRVQGWEG